jgi:serine/threonine protein kinase
MNYFNAQVIDILAAQGVTLSLSEKQAYIQACQNVERLKREQQYVDQKTKKNREESRPYSLWHTPVSTANSNLNHWLVLPGSMNWKTKDAGKSKDKRLIVTKLFINIVTGEKQFVKIRRPESRYSQDHITAAFAESDNNKKMGADTEVYTRYSSGKGRKGYLFQPYRGKFNLLNLLQNPSTSPRKLMDLLLTCGLALQKMHDKGYLHADFKPQNVVLQDDGNTVSLVDFEFMMSQSEGRAGQYRFFGTQHFTHPKWEADGMRRITMRYPIYYSTQNDVYAYLVTANLFLSEAYKRENDVDLKKTMMDIWLQIEHWKQLPFDQMPDLSSVLACLKGEIPKNNRESKLNAWFGGMKR